MDFMSFLKEQKISLNALAKACGIPYATLHNNVDNPSALKAANLRKISQYLGLAMEDVLVMLTMDNNSLLQTMLEQKRSNLKGNIYHYTQVGFAYNTNRIEGSRLTEDETRYIFETNTLIDGSGLGNVDDVVETANHFYLFDVMLEEANQVLTQQMIKHYHSLLKNGTEDARKEWFNVGDYKKLPNEVGGKATTPPEQVEKVMKQLLSWYNGQSTIDLNVILDFHHRFECIHPFQDGNGRIGRLIMFRECLRYAIVPFIIEDRYKAFYYRGLSNYAEEPGWLSDTCLTMQDNYGEVLKKFGFCLNGKGQPSLLGIYKDVKDQSD